MNRLSRIVVISDIHNGPDAETRPGTQAPELLCELVDEINHHIKPDAVVDLGDRINNSTSENDRLHALKVRELFDCLTAPCYLALGNHDISVMSKEDNRQVYRSEIGARVEKFAGINAVFLDTQDPTVEYVGGSVSKKQIDWLESQLSQDRTPTLVFSHHPLDEQNIRGNPHFVNFPHLARAEGRYSVRSLLLRHDNVIAGISGHVHWFSTWIRGGIPFVSIPSFTEALVKGRSAPGTYAELTIHNVRTFELTIHSLRPKVIQARFFWDRSNLNGGEA